MTKPPIIFSPRWFHLAWQIIKTRLRMKTLEQPCPRCGLPVHHGSTWANIDGHIIHGDCLLRQAHAEHWEVTEP